MRACRRHQQGRQHGHHGIHLDGHRRLIVGAIARLIMPGAQSMGWIMTSVIGIVGSLVGGWSAASSGSRPTASFHPAGFIMSILGALVVLWAYLQFAK
jgi:uncharacterized membrane protein YeaQ/YmgE (transglycosylase-associated protein family)